MPRILVADDNTNIQRMVSLAFHDRGIDVTAVGNGEAAVRRIPDLSPDLILADIFMPVRNGYELCEWVKKDSKYSHIPVILLVGAFDPLDEKEARRVGADGILKKPFIPPDPLIAMVTSVLEKAPKAAVEAPKPAEVIPPPPPIPVIVAPVALEMAPLIEAAPLAPSEEGDDASLAYGFGAGRGLEDEGPEIPLARHVPASESAKELEDEFDGASTTHEWRRSAMKFEIPEEAARRPAFSQDIESPFPSEKEAQSHQVSVAEAAVESVRTIERNHEPGSAPGAPQESLAAQPAAIAMKAVSVTNDQPVEEMQASEGLAGTPSAGVAPNIATVDAASAEAPQAEVARFDSVEENSSVRSTSIAGSDESVPKVEEFASTPLSDEPHSSATSRGSHHWMDLMASASEQPRGDWFSSVTRPSERIEAAPPEKEENALIESIMQSSAVYEAKAEAAPVAIESNPSEPAKPEASLELGASSSPVLHESVEDGHRDTAVPDDESFFADESETGPSSSLSEPLVAETELSAQAEAYPNGAEIPEHEELATESGSEAPSAQPVSTAAGTEFELMEEAAEEPALSKDPALIEPPAVRVTPEPLLIDEPARVGLSYGAPSEEIAPAYTFLSKVETQAQAETAAPRAEEKSNEPATMEVRAAEIAPERGMEYPAELSSSEFDDRMPSSTPSREALAEIPFLNPPRTFHSDADRSYPANGETAESVNVDAVVQRILEKIEPQIRELLSQNLIKPLIETLVQNELGKKQP